VSRIGMTRCQQHHLVLPCPECFAQRGEALDLRRLATTRVPAVAGPARGPNDPTPRDERYMGTD
jgi:hypothetical protein